MVFSVILGSLLAAALQTSGSATLQDENLIIPLPEEFKVGATSTRPHQRMVEYVLKNETVSNWSRLITQQTIFGIKNANPDVLPSAIAKGWVSACPGGETQKVFGDVEQGYPTSMWLFTCPLNPSTGKPETMWIKAISGADSYYSVQYAYRAVLSQELILPTMTYMKKVTVCDTRVPDRPCPLTK